LDSRQLSELRNHLAHVRFQSIDPNAPFGDYLPRVQSLQQTLDNRLSTLQQEAASVEQKIAELEPERAQFLTVQVRLRNLGYESPEEASDGLVKLEIRSLTLRAAESATQETLATQRNTNMLAIYEQVAQVWKAFTGDDNWRVDLDAEGIPRLENQEGRQFDLSQFSGGEKTALLIMLHTIIAHHFSKSHFLLLDEPLEHLDPINRRSLIDFLIHVYQQGGFKQAIVATFEESLIRKYMSDDGVNVIYL
jgi:DNA repair exonuclease SbcCD ATPase subunit